MHKYEGVIELVVRLVIKREGKILLCLNKKTDSYFLPGGHVEFGDTLEKTIYKEMGEELGWTAEDIKSISFKSYLENSYSYKNGAEVHNELNMVFDVEPRENVNVESKESHIDFEWMDLEKINTIKILPSTIVQFLQD